MRTIKQNFYDNFKCSADKCPCTCCSGWQIMIDEQSLDRYESAEGELGDRLNASIDWLEGAFMQKENRDCAFLNPNGLCDLISAAGEDILCDTCRLYPRHVEEYEDLREWSLSLSCPVAADMLCKMDTYMDFDVTDDDEEDPLEDEFEDFDFILFSKLQDARDVFFDIIKNDSVSFDDAVSRILELARQLQESYDSGDYFTMDDILENYRENPDSLQITDSVSPISFIKENMDVMDSLEILSDDWSDYLDLLSALNDSFTFGDRFIENVSPESLLLVRKNMLISLLYTYFLGSIYTGMIYGVTKMCIFSCLFTDILSQCKSASLKRNLTLSEYCEVLYKYSRETEHSDLNINSMLEYFDL